ncbi:MAG: hypothetical protein PF961_07730 [Planctomycetota bacterium]|jgi:hypothetical protein|nr:hypothetical protein [Planctomycetota bacterium]
MTTRSHPHLDETHSLLAFLTEHDLQPYKVDDLGDSDCGTITRSTHCAALAQAAYAVDECRLFVKHADRPLAVLLLVYGNSPGELVADYSFFTANTDPEARQKLDVVLQDWYVQQQGS